ncbi:cell division control protein 45 homolog [Centruroides vittatus]|uniref:cell division control protein 45 homolog n=1 Tax=Centruroides vittatus TaxID=120091 RepID=UPI00350F5FB8
MFVNDIKTDFYDVISDSRVLILAGFDVDSLCACRILQYLFHCDNILYTLIPIPGRAALVKAFKQHGEQVKYVIMINCGATIDVVELLQPKDEVVFYIADSHRPVDVYNVYNGVQVRLLTKPDDVEGIPEFDDIFREDESEDESDSDIRLNERVLERRRERRLWKEQRQKLMFDYTQFSYYGISTAVAMFELAWKLSKDTNDLLWWAIVGLTEQYLFRKIEQDKYVLQVGNLQTHVSRHNHVSVRDTNVQSVTSLRISFEKDLQLALYRHWSLYESLKHTTYTACKFRLWSLKGQKRLCEFLAEMGLPLVECKQKFPAMDMQLRNNVITWFEELAEKYRLDDIVYGSFVGKHGFRNKFCAADVVYSTLSLLETADKESDPTDRFLMALDSLAKKNTDLLLKGIEMVKMQLTAVFKQVQTILDLRQLTCAGPYLYAAIEEGLPEAKYFGSPGRLGMLARFLLQAQYSATKNRRLRNLPLVLATPSLESAGTSLVVGIPPIAEESTKNFFGKAFEQAAHKSRAEVILDYFDTSVVQLRTEDRAKFFDALISLLS